MIFNSCKKDVDPQENHIYQVSGNVQKGPYINGTDITLFELDENLNQTGKSFLTTIESNDGFFSFGNIELTSNLVLIKADGYFYSEVYGQNSPSKLTLYSIAQVGSGTELNVNILTHIEKDRLKYLIGLGLSYTQAKAQTRTELYNFFGDANTITNNPETLNMLNSSDENGLLFTASLLVQNYNYNSNTSTSVSTLINFLSVLSQDFKPDGIINQQNITQLMNNNMYLSLHKVENQFITNYQNMGLNIVLPDYKKYLSVFLDRNTNNNQIFLPDSAGYIPDYAFGNKLPNILKVNDGTTIHRLTDGNTFSLSALTPIDTSITIRVTGGPYVIISEGWGWFFQNNAPNGFMISSEINDRLMSMALQLTQSGNLTIEWYYNNATSPQVVKNLYYIN